jgi:hypothetical protein
MSRQEYGPELPFTALELFWLDDIRRQASPESDYGVMWRDGRAHPLWRVSYIQYTGEVYAQEQAGQERIRVLGQVPADPPPASTYCRTLDKILDGWADHGVNRGFDLWWVAERLLVHGRQTREQETR